MMQSNIPLMFPSSRKALWCHRSIGSYVDLVIPQVSVSVSEQVLFLAYGQSRSGKVEGCYLCGDVVIEPDCSEVVLAIDQLQSTDTKQCKEYTGAVTVPTKLKRNSRHEASCELSRDFLNNSLMSVSGRAHSANRVNVCEFMSATAECTLFAGTNQIHCDIDVDVILPNSKFTLTPIETVNVAKTALSKSVLGNEKHGLITSQPKSGYLTMDQYRKVVLLLESDPKVLSVPIIGIWISGVDLTTDPYIWSNCVRYMHTTQINDRVPKPLQPFLVVHKSPLMSEVQFFDCVPSTTALTYRALSGSQGFSMAKDACEKRRGKINCRLELQDLSTVKGRQLAEHVELVASSLDKENRMQATPKPFKNKRPQQKKTAADEDSLPWSSPCPYKSKESVSTPSVPEISMLDESNPLEAPRPTRHALHDVRDFRLNCSPNPKHNNLLISTQPIHREEVPEPAVRKIEFDDRRTRSAKDMLNTLYNKAQQPVCLSPSIRSPHHANNLHNHYIIPKSTSQEDAPAGVLYSASSHTPTPDYKNLATCKRDLRFSQPVTSTAASSQLNQPPTFPQADTHFQVINETEDSSPRSYQQPCATVTPILQPTCKSEHTCHCKNDKDRNWVSHRPVSSSHIANPLSIITDNVQRLLSPRVQTTPHASHSRHVDVSPIEEIQQTPNSNSPLSAHGRTLPVSPEVQEILRHQENQLKALQQQIQKLLQVQDTRPPAQNQQQSIETQTINTKCATVNTGISLLECAGFSTAAETHRRSTSDPHDSTNESSRSHSLIQHDLTTLDLPTQATSRSFTSDINVDYESFDDSPSGSPKRTGSENSRSDDSWQSPVLGESVSMLAEAENIDQESTKQQLDIIISNVRDLLAKHTPSKAKSTHAVDVQLNDDEIVQQNPESPEKYQVQHPTSPLPAASKTNDIGAATRAQLRKMGIELDLPAPPVVHDHHTPFPHVQYISMMMTDSMMSDSNKSLELNALALKYLQDDQLTELAQLTVHRSLKTRTHQTSLLRQVLTQPIHGGCHTFESVLETNNMSLASQQYLRRYALTDTTAEEISNYEHAPEIEVLDATPVNNLKSILRKETTQQDQTHNTSSATDASSVQVLDIARLRELPKLL